MQAVKPIGNYLQVKRTRFSGSSVKIRTSHILITSSVINTSSYYREVSGTQLRDAISARSNFGLGFALTHILIKSDESHRRKSIFDLAVADFDLAAAD